MQTDQNNVIMSNKLNKSGVSMKKSATRIDMLEKNVGAFSPTKSKLGATHVEVLHKHSSASPLPFGGVTHVDKFRNYRKTAFTLAEVLITLGIIGVVAALTLPALVQRQQEKAAAVKLKKAYSVISNAFNLAKNEHGNFSDWFGDTSSVSEYSQRFAEILIPYMNVSKNCGFNSGCLPGGNVKGLTGTGHYDYDSSNVEYKVILNDGTALSLYVLSPSCEGTETIKCGNIKVNVGGKKKAYFWGKDFFLLNIYPDRIMPAGLPEDTGWAFPRLCDLNSQSQYNGIACSAWVIFNENMDYLHCTDLSWSGKTKCSK